MRKTQVAGSIVAVACLMAGLLLSGCEGAKEPVDQTAQQLETASDTLGDALMGQFTNPNSDAEWDLESAEATLDEERFPDWARGRYDVCIHWTISFSLKIFNNNRRPGNSSVFIMQPADGWGWILIGDREDYILELGYQLRDYDPVILVDLWDTPG
jgi:hypothetical protein